jgi:hypothetical protein
MNNRTAQPAFNSIDPRGSYEPTEREAQMLGLATDARLRMAFFRALLDQPVFVLLTEEDHGRHGPVIADDCGDTLALHTCRSAYGEAPMVFTSHGLARRASELIAQQSIRSKVVAIGACNLLRRLPDAALPLNPGATHFSLLLPREIVAMLRTDAVFMSVERNLPGLPEPALVCAPNHTKWSLSNPVRTALAGVACVNRAWLCRFTTLGEARIDVGHIVLIETSRATGVPPSSLQVDGVSLPVFPLDWLSAQGASGHASLTAVFDRGQTLH